MAPLLDHSGLPAAARERLARAVARQSTLEQALEWGRSHEPPLRVETILTADEFSHDVLMPFEAGRYLVYDTT